MRLSGLRLAERSFPRPQMRSARHPRWWLYYFRKNYFSTGTALCREPASHPRSGVCPFSPESNYAFAAAAPPPKAQKGLPRARLPGGRTDARCEEPPARLGSMLRWPCAPRQRARPCLVMPAHFTWRAALGAFTTARPSQSKATSNGSAPRQQEKASPKNYARAVFAC